MSSGLRVLHDFTDDADSLRRRIDTALIAMPLEATTDTDKAVVEAEQFVEMFATDRQLAAEAVEMARVQLETDMLAKRRHAPSASPKPWRRSRASGSISPASRDARTWCGSATGFRSPT